MHFKASTSFYLQCDPTLKVNSNDLEIKKCLGIDRESIAIEEMKNKGSSRKLSDESPRFGKSLSMLDVDYSIMEP